jgi:hypothetical protein
LTHAKLLSCDQCCQLAEISAAKHKSGPIKTQRPEEMGGEILVDLKKWQKSGQTFLVCVLYIKALINEEIDWTTHGFTPLFLLLI